MYFHCAWNWQSERKSVKKSREEKKIGTAPSTRDDLLRKYDTGERTLFERGEYVPAKRNSGNNVGRFLRVSSTGRDTPARSSRVARISWTLEWKDLYDRSLLLVDSSPVSLLLRTASPCREKARLSLEEGWPMRDATRGETGWTRGFLVPLNLSAWETRRRESTVFQKNGLFYHWMVNSNVKFRSRSLKFVVPFTDDGMMERFVFPLIILFDSLLFYLHRWDLKINRFCFDLLITRCISENVFSDKWKFSF